MTQMNIGPGSGPAFSFYSIEASIAGRIYNTISAISIDDAYDPGELRGTSPKVLRFTDGPHTGGGSFTIPFEDYLDFQSNISDANGQWGMQEFDITVTFATRQNPGNMKVISCLGCIVVGSPLSTATSNEATSIEVSFRCLDVVKDGRRAYLDFV